MTEKGSNRALEPTLKKNRASTAKRSGINVTNVLDKDITFLGQASGNGFVHGRASALAQGSLLEP